MSSLDQAKNSHPHRTGLELLPLSPSAAGPIQHICPHFVLGRSTAPITQCGCPRTREPASSQPAFGSGIPKPSPLVRCRTSDCASPPLSGVLRLHVAHPGHSQTSCASFTTSSPVARQMGPTHQSNYWSRPENTSTQQEQMAESRLWR